MRRDLDWDVYRYFMAIVDEGSLSAASRVLGVSQPTVGRKLQEIETKFRVRLFEREVHGYVLTEAGKSIVSLCRKMEANTSDIERTIARHERSLAGEVRITTAVGLGTYWLAPRLPILKAEHPSIDVQLLENTPLVDLSHQEADVALHIGDPGSDELIGRKVGEVSFGIYGAEAYWQQHGQPDEPAALKDHVIVEATGIIAELPQMCRLRDVAAGAKIGVQCDNLTMQIAAARAGVGVIALPFYIARTMPDLKRVLASAFDLRLDLWLLTHRDLKSMLPIRTVFDFVTSEVSKDDLSLDAQSASSSAAA